MESFGWSCLSRHDRIGLDVCGMETTSLDALVVWIHRLVEEQDRCVDKIYGSMKILDSEVSRVQTSGQRSSSAMRSELSVGSRTLLFFCDSLASAPMVGTGWTNGRHTGREGTSMIP